MQPEETGWMKRERVVAATWKHEEEMDGSDELHHSISQELQPLVVRNLKESKL